MIARLLVAAVCSLVPTLLVLEQQASAGPVKAIVTKALARVANVTVQHHYRQHGDRGAGTVAILFDVGGEPKVHIPTLPPLSGITTTRACLWKAPRSCS